MMVSGCKRNIINHEKRALRSLWVMMKQVLQRHTSNCHELIELFQGEYICFFREGVQDWILEGKAFMEKLVARQLLFCILICGLYAFSSNWTFWCEEGRTTKPELVKKSQTYHSTAVLQDQFIVLHLHQHYFNQHLDMYIFDVLLGGSTSVVTISEFIGCEKVSFACNWFRDYGLFGVCAKLFF